MTSDSPNPTDSPDSTDSPNTGSANQPDESQVADGLAGGISLLITLMVFQRGFGFIRNILFCRILSPEELGRWNLAFSAMVLIAPLLVLGLPGSFGRYVEYYRHRGQMRAFLRRILIVSTGLAAAGLGILLIGGSYTSWLIFGDQAQWSLTISLIVSLAFVILFNLLVELCTSLRKVRLMSWMQLANSLLFGCIALGLMYFYRQTALVVVWGYGAACAITSVLAIPALWRATNALESDPTTPPHRSFWSKVVPFATWVWLSDFLSNLFTAADRYMIIHFSHLEASGATELVGQYHSSRVFPELIMTVAALIARVLLPYLSNDWEAGDKQRVSERVNLSMKFFGVSATLAASAVLVISPWLFGWALGGKYADGLAVLPMTLTYCIWAGLFVIFHNYLFCAEKASGLTICLIVGLTANITLNFLLLPIMGLLGAVIATAAGNFLAVATCFLLSQRQGMTVELGTVLVFLLPLCLIFGTIPAVATSIVFLWFSLRSNHVLTTNNFNLIFETIDEAIDRFAPQWTTRLKAR